jgi:hypothetical protein
VVDVLTGEVLFTDLCNDRDSHTPLYCGDGEDIKLLQARDKVFDEIVK